MADENQVDQQAVEQEARGMGWLPKEEFKGKEENWVDAGTFVEKGRHILPIVQANNKRLEGQVQNLSQTLAQTQAALKAANAAIDAIEESQTASSEAQREQALTELKEQIAAASRDGDHATVVELTEKMVDLKAAAPKADDDKDKNKERGRNDDAPQVPTHIVEEIKTWYGENQAFLEDPRVRRMARVIGEELLAGGETARGRAFLDKVKAEVESTLGKSPRQGKVNGGNGGQNRSSGGGGEGSKTFNDLPKEAKEAAARMTSRMVGPDKKYKTQEDWYKGYTKSYFSQEQA